MSDTTYEVFQHYGLSSERLAFTPAPAAGIQPLYVWFETDTGNTFLYYTEWVQLNGGGSGNPTPNKLSYLVSGGGIAWLSSYDFEVATANYYIQGFPFASAQTIVTLDTADSDPRIDIIVVDTSGVVSAVKGTAAVNPSTPVIDPATQLQLGLILVPASAAPTVTNTAVYSENAGGPTEWNPTTSGTGIATNGSTNPRTGTYCVEATNLPANSYVQFEKPTGSLDPSTVDILVIYIRSKVTWASAKTLAITLRLNGVQVGNSVTVSRSGTFGFTSSVTASYQLLAIPVTAFAVPGGSLINQVRITGLGSGTTQGFYLDDILFQVSGASQTGGGFTQAEADARYLMRANNLSDLASATLATAQLSAVVGDTGSGGVKGLVPAPATGDAAAGKYLKASGAWAVPPGDVKGPATNEDNNIVQFKGADSKELEDSGYTAAELIAAGGAAGPQGDVTAAASLDDNAVIRGDGGAKGVQKTGVTIDNSNNIAGAASVAIGGALVAQTKHTVIGQSVIVPSDHSAVGSTETVDFAVSNRHTIILDENLTLTFSNPVNGATYVIILIQDGAGTNTVTWPAAVKWPGGTAPVVTATASKADLVTLYYNGTVYFGSFNQNYAIS
jgi:hypothetical protein